LLASGCSQTRYVEIPEGKTDEPTASSLARTVEYRQDDELLVRPPNCFLVVGSGNDKIAAELVDTIEQSLTRHLLQRTKRVLSGAARDREGRRLGVAVIDTENARYIAERAGCDGIVEYEVTDAEARYLLFYTRFSLTLDVRARRTTGMDLWRARHASAKSSGGPPTSFASVVSIWSATELAGDDEAAAGLVEEIVRRIMATWPIVKRPA
jgi:hypothetical protein